MSQEKVPNGKGCRKYKTYMSQGSVLRHGNAEGKGDCQWHKACMSPRVPEAKGMPKGRNAYVHFLLLV
ncbi:unnamed protein product [Prunus armeniaca]